jgi:hypothetical protein
MALQVTLVVSAIYLALVGLALMFAPLQFGVGAIPPDASRELLALLRLLGGPFLGIAALNWLARDVEPSPARRAIIVANVVGFGAVAANDVWGVASGEAREAAKAFLAVHLAFALAFVFFGRAAVKRVMTSNTKQAGIDARIKSLGDWRGAVLARVRALIKDAVPDVVEDVKWRKPSSPAGVPVWERDGLLCTGETYKDKVKLTFAQGAALADPKGLFNASLDAGTRRAIDIREGDAIDATAFKALVRAAAALNAERAETRPTGARKKR